jgi:hypothetical protein
MAGMNECGDRLYRGKSGGRNRLQRSGEDSRLFHIILKGCYDMDYQIIEKPAFDAVGKARKFTTVNGENLRKIPQFWQEFNSPTLL